MLSVLQKKITKGPKETFRSDSYVSYLDCGDGIMDICICLNLSNCIY